MERNEVPGEDASLKMVGERVNAWWTAVLAGQADQSHPVQGSTIAAALDGDTLVVSGEVPSAGDLDEVRSEVEHLQGHGVAHVRVQVTVKPVNDEQEGILRQTIVATFADAEQAGFAAGYLEGHGHVSRDAMRIVEPGQGDDAERQAMVDALGKPYDRDRRATLARGHSTLIATVDETEAFRVRELLDEEVRSLRTVVLPPRPSRPSRRDGGPASSPEARRAEARAIASEERVHHGP